jgi:hypothetical protein
VRALKQKLTSRMAATRPNILVTLSTTTVAVPAAAFAPELMADGLEKVDRIGSSVSPYHITSTLNCASVRR